MCVFVFRECAVRGFANVQVGVSRMCVPSNVCASGNVKCASGNVKCAFRYVGCVANQTTLGD